MSKIKNELNQIKSKNSGDYLLLLIAAHYYKNCDNKQSKQHMVSVVKEILDKHGVKYVDNVTGGIV